jgi:hypothetical protein
MDEGVKHVGAQTTPPEPSPQLCSPLVRGIQKTILFQKDAIQFVWIQYFFPDRQKLLAEHI